MRFAFPSFALAILVAACEQHHVYSPNEPDIPPGPKLPEGDGDGTPLGAMCAHLRDVRCGEGFPKTRNGKTRTCFQTMTMAEDNAKIPIACVTKAVDQKAVRECGDPMREITFRCTPAP